MKRRGPNTTLIALLSTLALAALVGVIFLADQSQRQTPQERQGTAKPKHRPRAVVKDNHPPDPPLTPVRDDSRLERIAAYNRELKDVRNSIETTKERMSIMRKLATIRSENSSNAAVERYSPAVGQAIEATQRAGRDEREYADLKIRLADLLDRETELELAIARE